MRLMWARYAFHAKKLRYKALWMKVVILPAFFIYLVDRLILINFFYRKNKD